MTDTETVKMHDTKQSKIATKQSMNEYIQL